MHRILPLVFLVLFILIGLYLYLPTRRFLAYKFHLVNDPTTSCCDIAEVMKSNGDFDENANTAIFENQPVDYPKTSLVESISQIADAVNPENSQVLGITTNAAGDEKWIEVSLSEQKLRAWEGNKVVMEFPISSGKWYPTPVGTYHIYYKTRFQRMVGGSKQLGTYYDLPNVPNNMFFYQGFAIHGAYWHNNFGHPMSHGCINEPLANAQQMFDWAGPVVPPGVNTVRATDENPGTRVVIHT